MFRADRIPACMFRTACSDLKPAFLGSKMSPKCQSIKCLKVALYRARALSGLLLSSVKTSASNSAGRAKPITKEQCHEIASVRACRRKKGAVLAYSDLVLEVMTDLQVLVELAVLMELRVKMVHLTMVIHWHI